MDKVVEQLGPVVLVHRDGAVVASPTQDALKVRNTHHSCDNKMLWVITRPIAQGAKFVAFYFSASWCGPCRAFTPALSSAYLAQVPDPTTGVREVEVVFVSADNDEKSFNSYFSHQPWIALPFDSEARSALPTAFSVWGIPKLSIVDMTDGHLVMGDAAGTVRGEPTLAGLFKSEMRDAGSWLSCSVQ